MDCIVYKNAICKIGGHCWKDKLCLNKILTRLLANNLYKIRYGINTNGYITSKKNINRE